MMTIKREKIASGPVSDPSKDGMAVHRRKLLAGLGVFAMGVNTRSNGAEAGFPTRLVRIVVPFPAGSSPDLAARHIARALGDLWKQPVVVDNKPGADSLIGTMDVVRSKPDGHTILFTISQVLTNPLVRRNAGYDSTSDLRPVTAVSTADFFLAVPAQSSITSLKQYLEQAKTRPVTFGTLGAGWSVDMAVVALERHAGVKIERVPYKGTNEVVIALSRGDIDSGLIPLVAAQQLGDKIRLIAAMARQRSPLLPGVATFEESGVMGVSRPNWIGLFVPAKTSSDVVQTISRGVNLALREPQLTQYFQSVAFTPSPTTPTEFDAFIKDEYKFYESIIQSANIRLD